MGRRLGPIFQMGRVRNPISSPRSDGSAWDVKGGRPLHRLAAFYVDSLGSRSVNRERLSRSPATPRRCSIRTAPERASRKTSTRSTRARVRCPDRSEPAARRRRAACTDPSRPSARKRGGVEASAEPRGQGTDANRVVFTSTKTSTGPSRATMSISAADVRTRRPRISNPLRWRARAAHSSPSAPSSRASGVNQRAKYRGNRRNANARSLGAARTQASFRRCSPWLRRSCRSLRPRPSGSRSGRSACARRRPLAASRRRPGSARSVRTGRRKS